MQKLLVTIIALSSLLNGNETQVKSFLQKGIGSNPNITSLDISVVDKVPMDEPDGWEAYIVQLKGTAKMGGKTKPISQRSIYFVGDGLITAELYDLKTGEKLNSKVSPPFKDKYYDAKHKLFGNKSAAHKVVIFSDPLCPFCRSYVPKALKYMKQYPDNFEVFYYHFPLQSLHPAAIPLVKAALAAEMKGEQNVVENLYKVKVDGREKNVQKIIDAFNKVQGTKITLKDIADPAVNEQLKHGMKVAQEHLVNGTPTVFFDGTKDSSKLKYKTVKIIK
jgi:protein-disulfide isomerase